MARFQFNSNSPKLPRVDELPELQIVPTTQVPIPDFGKEIMPLIRNISEDPFRPQRKTPKYEA
ncbi:MAG: hypothetical protein OXT65_10770 [Alphaproteobacteria bacterium]|nr:hypothetical protein [Alphaproteobacteria bacterium]